MTLWIGPVPYNATAKAWLAASGHYLDNPPPGALYAVGVREAAPGLAGIEVGVGPLLGLCLIGRPTARALSQTGSLGEVTRMVLAPGLPHGTASAVLRFAAQLGRARGVASLIAYHDRTRHTGCIYRKAGFRKDGTTLPKPGAWASRPGRKSGDYAPAAKRRWRLDLSEAP